MEKIFRIHSIIAGIYHLYDDKTHETLKIPAAGKLRYQGVTPVVGDLVEVKDNLITKVLERKNEFIRPKVANIDQMFIFMSIKEPEFQSFLVDKYLAIVESKNIIPFLCLTKVDLDNVLAKQWLDYYQGMNYQVFLIDNDNPNYYDAMHPFFKDEYSVFMGQSGVGKTTTLNYLGNHDFETQQISKALGRGKHTTRVVQAIPFNEGFLIDTPGFSSLELNMTKIELAQSFKSFKELAKTCKFRSCLHINEPENFCAVKQKVGTLEVPTLRYENYLKLQKELD
ncbi:ribosome small subunit-dependent GTPase A [Mycoplasma hafezii]|uniref:ribosome small subunit-dependent GTPase A n=1 Tax=Mycoplasma hafezii TaxID=525886 RepID=UPI003CE8EDF1